MSETLERICYNCSSFFTDINDLEGDFGVCIQDEAFDAYQDEILENNLDFSICMDLYKEKRFDGNRDVCSDYDEIEIIEDEESENGSQGAQKKLVKKQYLFPCGEKRLNTFVSCVILSVWRVYI